MFNLLQDNNLKIDPAQHCVGGVSDTSMLLISKNQSKLSSVETKERNLAFFFCSVFFFHSVFGVVGMGGRVATQPPPLIDPTTNTC